MNVPLHLHVFNSIFNNGQQKIEFSKQCPLDFFNSFYEWDTSLGG